MTTSSYAEEVLIVGAGPTGLTLACQLLRQGIPVRLIDQAEAPAVRLKALLIHARTLQAFATMGIVDELIAKGVQLHGMNAYANGQRIVHIRLNELETVYPYFLSVPQSEIEQTLTGLLECLGGRVERGIALWHLQQDSHGVTATLRHQNGREQETRVTWLVGCDGAHSTVHHALALPCNGPREAETFLLADADVRLDGMLPADEGHTFFAPDGPLSILPLPDNRWRVIAQEPDAQGTCEPMFTQLRKRLATHGLAGTLLSDPLWMAFLRLQRCMVPTYHVNHIFLAGDAVHVYSPVDGLGLNLGIQDACNLAWKLALTMQGAARPLLLASYQAERSAVAAAAFVGTDLAAHGVPLRHLIGPVLRPQLTNFLSTLGVGQHPGALAATGLPWSYAQSPIVDEHCTSPSDLPGDAQVNTESHGHCAWRDFGAAPAAGEPALDGLVYVPATSISKRLFDLLWTGQHLLLLFNGRATTAVGYARLAATAVQVRKWYGTLFDVYMIIPRATIPDGLAWDGAVLLDPTGMLHQHYGAGAECLYLLRPDGYIGYRSQPADIRLLFAYLATLFTTQRPRDGSSSLKHYGCTRTWS